MHRRKQKSGFQHSKLVAPTLPRGLLDQIYGDSRGKSSSGGGGGGGCGSVDNGRRGQSSSSVLKQDRGMKRKRGVDGEQQQQQRWRGGGGGGGGQRPSSTPDGTNGTKKAESTDGGLRGEKTRIKAAAASSSLRPLKRTKIAEAKEKETPQLPDSSARAEQKEDEYIAYLEAKLGHGRKKGKGKLGGGGGGLKKRLVVNGDDDEEGDDKGGGFEEGGDGLDDLLDFADSILPQRAKTRDISEESGREDEDEEDEDKDDEGPMSEDLSDMEASDSSYASDSEANDDHEDWGGIQADTATVDGPGSSPSQGGTENATPVRYVPPHLRNTQESAKPSEAMIKLSRQLNGLLNRMSEQNLATVLDSIEEIYRGHRRNDVTSTITTLIINSICSHSSLLDSYVVLYAALVSSLHKVVGVEFAAYFVQNVVTLYEQHLASCRLSSDASNTEGTGKECSNLAVLLSELYNFQVISSVLIFDVIRDLLTGDLSEMAVELLLKIVRNSGQQLRQDDPSALKDIVQLVHDKVSDKTDNLSSRTRFMIETLTNLKNNKLKRNATQNQGGDAVERMKKFLTGLAKKRHVLAHEPLRFSLADLHSAETRGKWWLVGAAWGGDPLAERQAEIEKSKPTSAVENPADTQTTSHSQPTQNALLKLAKKQGMNTDIRRSIFVVLMSSDDYVDACERLAQLSLTEVQQREIVRVLLHCCGNERSYNPYYTLICQNLCRSSHSYKITLQFCLWDFLRDLGETSVGGAEVIRNLKDDNNLGFEGENAISDTRLENVAKAYAWWIAKDCVTLAILKPVDFTILKPQSTKFMSKLVAEIFLNSQISTPTIGSLALSIPKTRTRSAIDDIFRKATRMQSLAMGLVYFLTNVYRSRDSREKRQSSNDVQSELTSFLEWAKDVAVDTLRAEVDVI